MARYREVADDLRARIGSGEFRSGDQLPTIPALQAHYDVPGLNTIRQAQRLLIDDGLIEAQQGRGVFVLRTSPEPRPVDVLAELRTAHGALGRIINELERQSPAPGQAAT